MLRVVSLCPRSLLQAGEREREGEREEGERERGGREGERGEREEGERERERASKRRSHTDPIDSNGVRNKHTTVKFTRFVVLSQFDA